MFERYYRELLNFLTHRVGNRDLASDLVQESYARAYAAASERRVTEPRALLYATARNLVIDHHRHSGVRAAVEQSPPSTTADTGDEADEHAGPRHFEPEVALSSSQGIAAMVAAIEALPPRCREAFMLNRFEDMSYAQVASHMGISVKTVEQHLKTALDACERCRALSAGQPTGAKANTTPRVKSPSRHA